MNEFEADIKIIGINPFIFIPEELLVELFKIHGKEKGPIPIKGEVNGNAYQQTLVKYKGSWRLYINSKMLQNSPGRIGESILISVEYDPSDRTIAPHPKLLEALNKNRKAQEKFDSLTPSLQKEIVRYISLLKSDASIDRNVKRAVNFLLGKESFIGREPLK